MKTFEHKKLKQIAGKIYIAVNKTNSDLVEQTD